jgi:ribosome-associated protein
MDIKKLQTLVVDALEDVKAQDIMLFDTVHLTSLFDRVVVASGTSNRQTKALAASVRDKIKDAGGNIVSTEGEDTGEWVLVDLGDMIVHIMQPPIRAYYRLEEIWGDKEIKLGAAKRISKRSASEPEDQMPKKTARHLTLPGTSGPAIAVTDPDAPKARKPRSAAGKDKTEAPAKKVVAKKVTAKTVPATKAVGKTVKVASSKSAEAAVKATKAKPPKVAKPVVPAKTVIKRKTAKAAE